MNAMILSKRLQTLFLMQTQQRAQMAEALSAALLSAALLSETRRKAVVASMD